MLSEMQDLLPRHKLRGFKWLMIANCEAGLAVCAELTVERFNKSYFGVAGVGKSLGNCAHKQPVAAMYLKVFDTARTPVRRGCPIFERVYTNGLISAHSAYVQSLA